MPKTLHALGQQEVGEVFISFWMTGFPDSLIFALAEKHIPIVLLSILDAVSLVSCQADNVGISQRT